jgi:hypothetical protein
VKGAREERIRKDLKTHLEHVVMWMNMAMEDLSKLDDSQTLQDDADSLELFVDPQGFSTA